MSPRSAQSPGAAAACLVLGVPRRGIELPATRVDMAAPTTIGALRGALGERGARFDGALICTWAPELAIDRLAAEVRRSVEVGGKVTFACPITDAGWRQALLGALRRHRVLPLEDLCGALLRGGLVDVRARRLDKPAGYALVWGRVPPRQDDEVTRSSIRPAGG